MFQFARCPPLGLYIQPRVTRHHSGGVAPFGISGLLARMQLPLNVSPVSASFIGLQRLGIHLVLSLACVFICTHARARALLAAQAHTTFQAPLSLLSSVFFLPSAKLK